MSIINVEGLVKDFHRPKRQAGRFGALRTLITQQVEITRAVDGVSFSVEEGEILGYIGPNGAGKSTTIKVLTGILVPTAGKVHVAGLVPWEDRERNALNIGVVFGQRSQLWWDLPLIESLKLIAKMYRVPSAQYKAKLEQFTKLLDMNEFMNTPVRQLSLGQRMRGDLVAGMLYEPRVIYLDEPTVGLDLLAKERILGFIQNINKENHTTIFLTTHDLSDVERLCRRVLLINHGKIVYDGSLEHLKIQYAPYRVLVAQLSPSGLDDVNGRTIALCGAEVIQCEGLKIWLRFDPRQIPIATLIGRLTARYPVIDLSIEEPDLESVVRHIYESRPATQ